jgi:hypothetical protein
LPFFISDALDIKLLLRRKLSHLQAKKQEHD